VPGLEILRRFRQRSDVPVLVLSARNDGETRVRGLQLGADDYLAKPFWPEELVERVRARLRRPTLQRATAIEVGALRVDLHTREVTVDGASVALTGTEYAILAALARRRGAPVTRQSLGELLDADNENPDRTVDVHVSRLRKKLGEAGASIVTVWGIGYRLGGCPTP
jgi:two-component system response regulator MtrA